MKKCPVLQVDDTKSSRVKKDLDNKKIIFKALESTWHYFHSTLIKPFYLVNLLFSKGKHTAFQHSLYKGRRKVTVGTGSLRVSRDAAVHCQRQESPSSFLAYFKY